MRQGASPNAPAVPPRVDAEDHLLAAVLDVLDPGVIVVDSGERVRAVNVAAYRLLGLTDRPRAGRPAVLALGEAASRCLEGALRPRSGPGTGVFTAPSGRLGRWTRRQLPDGYALLLTDESRREADRQDLRRRNRERAELLAMKADLAKAVSHELRTPLTSMLSMAEALKDCASADELTAQAVDAMVRGAYRLRDIVDELTLLGGVEAGTVPLAMDEVDLAALARTVVAAAPGAVRVVGGGPAVVRGDARLLRRLVETLVGIAVSVAGRDSTVDVSIGVAAEAFRLTLPVGGSVGDRLFTAAAGSPESGSTSLTLARAIAARHGGRIGVVHDPAAGLALVLELPLLAAG